MKLLQTCQKCHSPARTAMTSHAGFNREDLHHWGIMKSEEESATLQYFVLERASS